MAPPEPKRVAILGFHKIGEPAPDGWATWFYIPEQTFRRQLAALGNQGWRVIDLNTFVEGLAAPSCLPDRAALLTFDDGHRSLREVALPCLRDFGHPAVLFIPTDYIGKRSEFDPDEPIEDICDWEDLRVLRDHGVSIQSHSASHRAFSALDPGEQDAELRSSKAILEAGLNQPVHAFAFPYGDDGRNPGEVGGMLEDAGYLVGFLYGGDAWGVQRLPAADRFQLARVAMGPDTDLAAELMREPRRIQRRVGHGDEQ
jgi:peptidoglycan/xylan/chitin deacetylase (PgdA/CDA1 family)